MEVAVTLSIETAEPPGVRVIFCGVSDIQNGENAARVTFPEKPLTLLATTLALAVPPCANDTKLGFMESWKLGPVTVTKTEVKWIRLPLVASTCTM